MNVHVTKKHTFMNIQRDETNTFMNVWLDYVWSIGAVNKDIVDI